MLAMDDRDGWQERVRETVQAVQIDNDIFIYVGRGYVKFFKAGLSEVFVCICYAYSMC